MVFRLSFCTLGVYLEGRVGIHKRVVVSGFPLGRTHRNVSKLHGLLESLVGALGLDFLKHFRSLNVLLTGECPALIFDCLLLVVGFRLLQTIVLLGVGFLDLLYRVGFAELFRFEGFFKWVLDDYRRLCFTRSFRSSVIAYPYDYLSYDFFRN